MTAPNHRNPTDDSPSGRVTGGNPPAQSDEIVMAQQRQERYYAERSAEWFASVKEGDTVPDLDFDTPLCSICTRSTHYEEGSFYCETCSVWWPRTGYGSQAVRYDDDGNVVALTGSSEAPRG